MIRSLPAPGLLSPFWLAALVILLVPHAGAQSAQSAPPPHRDSVPIVLTVEGGGSVGVYEAGMTWALTEMFKRDGARAESQRHFQKLYLASATGASAGSINALLAATSWCDAVPHQPEESLFWRTWIRAGVNTLLPKTYPERGDWGYGEQGVLSRAYFERVAFPTLKAQWDSLPAPNKWRPNCRVPVGATVTRLDADTMLLTSSVRAHNIHVASTFDVAVDSNASGRFLTFQARKDDRDRPEAGRIAAMPTRRDATIGLDTIFRLFAASSGYPVAFAPQRVPFVYGAGSDYPCGATNNPCSVKEELFVDGGVFDNGPLALAIDLYFGAGFWTGGVQKREPVPVFPHVLFVTTGARRTDGGNRSEALPPHAEANSDRVGGLAGGFKLIASAVPAAREYEIQALVRLLRTEPYQPSDCEHTEDCFVAPDRWHPIVGDRLYGFGAFLARPFREYDFYVGIYDGLMLAARSVSKQGADSLCHPTPVQASRECVRRRVHDLIEHPLIDLGPVAPCMLRRLYAAEFEPARLRSRSPEDTLIGRPGCFPHVTKESSPSDSSLRVIGAVADAMGRLMHDTVTSEGKARALAQENCRVEGPLHGLLCDQGLLSVADDLRNDHQTFAILKRWNKDSACRDGLSPEEAANCRADGWFVRWTDNTRRETHALFRNALKRLDETTPHGEGGNFAAVAGVHALSMAFLSANETYRYGVDLGQTSLPERGSLASTVGWELLPSSLSFPLTAAGSIAGWEARFVFKQHLSMVLPAQLAFSAMRTSQQVEGSRWYAVPGVGFGVVPYSWMHLPGIISSIRPEMHWWMGGNSERGQWHRERFSYGVTTFLSSNKLRVSFFHQPDMFTNQRYKHVMYALGIHDVNGLAYWIKHLNGH